MEGNTAKDDPHLSGLNSLQKSDGAVKTRLLTSPFLPPLILFLAAFLLRAIPEIMVGKYPIGSDTITFYAPYVARFRFDPINMFFWGHLVSWLIMKIVYVLTADPYVTMKIVGPAFYGFLIFSFYEFLVSIGWFRKKAFLVSLFALVQVPMLRLSWDLFHNVLGLSFMFLALGELGRMRPPSGTARRAWSG